MPAPGPNKIIVASLTFALVGVAVGVLALGVYLGWWSHGGGRAP